MGGWQLAAHLRQKDLLAVDCPPNYRPRPTEYRQPNTGPLNTEYRTPPSAYRLPIFVLALAAAAGCAGHAATMADVRAALLAEDLDEARALLAEAGRGTDDLLFALEDGLLLHYAGDPELSNSRLEFAEQRVDDLYTKSITRAALSLIASDLVLRFEPRGIEPFLINYYRSLNYLELGDVEGAWVEWRKLASKLQFSRDNGDAPYHDPPFFNHLIGLGLELDDPSNAYVSLRLAEAGYLEAGLEPPEDLVADLFRLARFQGLADHLADYEARYGRRTRTPGGNGFGEGPAAAPDWGELVVLIEDGLVAPIEEVSAYIPVTRTRARALHDGDGAPLNLAEALAVEYHAGQYAGVSPRHAHRVEIAYVLPISFPVFGAGDPAFQRVAALAGDDTASARLALEVSAVQGSAFQDRLLWVYAKTIGRALIKMMVAEELEEKAEEERGEAAGDLVGILANVVNVVTERADTRAWLGLPHRIWIARLRVPPGVHDVRLLFDGRAELELGEIDLRPYERRFISYRAF